MAKGYHFPNLSFVGVLDADAGLVTGGDMRAIERTYNLIATSEWQSWKRLQ